MKVTIDTVNKTIEIEEATTDELKQLCKDYKGFKIQSKVIYNNYPYYYTQPYTIPVTTDPYWHVTGTTLTTSN